MLKEFLDSGTLNLVYAGVVLSSFVFAVITLVGAEFSDALSLDFDVDADTDSGLDFISVSPFALAMFGAAFGMAGLITRLWLEMEAIPSILWAVGVGTVVGTAAQAFFLYVLSPTKSSHFSLAGDTAGREAEVIITIPKKGLGTIAFDNISGRVTLGARSSTGKQIQRGALVTIERVTGRVAVVRPLDKK
ncbi:MAG: hypothetical protein ACE5E7_00340 [Anaerolineae bacterium]